MASKNEISARERIIETALDLFYKQGYLATGINQVISEAKVAKATFYANFASKESLCIAYLQTRHEIWMGWLRESVDHNPNPRERLLGIFSFLQNWMQESNFRGCAFLNIASEVPLAESGIRNEVVKHKNNLQEFISGALFDLVAGQKYKPGLDYDELAKMIYVLVEGAIVSSQNYSAVWPIVAARKAVEVLLTE